MKKSFWVVILSSVLLLTGCGGITGDDRDENTDPTVLDYGFDSELHDQDDASGAVSDDPLVYYPYAFNSVPDDAKAEFADYIHENLTLMGTLVFNVCQVDVTGDGYDDICASYFTGSGIVTSGIIVYDPQVKQGYRLDDREMYDYTIEDVAGGKLIVKRSRHGLYGEQENSITGTAAFEDGELFFDAGLDRMGVPYKVLKMFNILARHSESGYAASGNYLSSMEPDDLLLLMIGIDREKTELVHAVDGDEYDSMLEKIPYDDWENIVRDVYMEEDPAILLEKLDEYSRDDATVYYSSDDDCIYMDYKYTMYDSSFAEVSDVCKDGDIYVITYEVYAQYYNPKSEAWPVRITIEKADNEFGYRLVGVE